MFQESLDLSLEARKLFRRSSSKESLTSLIFQPMPIKTTDVITEMEQIPMTAHISEIRRVVLPSFEKNVEEYSGRKLTFDSDGLNAIRSVIDTWSDMGLYHLCGLTVFPLDQSGYRNFARALFWSTPKVRPMSDARRRHEFLSWTWVGWKASMYWSRSSYGNCALKVQYFDDDEKEFRPVDPLNRLLPYPHPLQLMLEGPAV